MFCNKVVKNNKGQALIEIILAIAMAAIFLAALATGVIAAREGFARSGKSLEATLIIQKEAEAVRSIKETAWNSVPTGGPYHTQLQPDYSWVKKDGAITENGFTRSFTVENVCRMQTTSPPVICGSLGAFIDPSTKKITANVSWSGFGSRGVSSVFYISRYFGNTNWLQTTAADFNAGTPINTVVVNKAGGEVELNPTSSTADYGNRFLVYPPAPSSIGSMTSQTMKTSLRFTAQNSKTVNAIRVYLQAEAGTSPNYRYGIQADVAGNPTGTYLGSGTRTATATGWVLPISISPAVTLTAGTPYHLVVQWNSGTINTSRYIALRRSNPLNGLYPYSNIPDAAGNTLFNSGAGWGTPQGYQPIYELDFSDATYEGNPYETYTEVAVFGANFIGERFRFTDTNRTATGISFYVRKQNNPPNPLTIVLQDIGTGQTYTCSIPAAQVTTTYAYQSCTFSPSVTLAQNSNYRIYLRTTGGTNNNSYRVYHIDTSNSANYTSITYDGTNSVYTASTNSGSSWTDTNYWDIGGFRFTIQISGFATSGTFESQTFNASSIVGFNYVTMTVNEPAGTNIRLQVATKNNILDPWNFVGPDGSGGSYFDNSGAIHLYQIPGQYLRFKASLAGNGTLTPTLYDVTTNYSP